MRKPAAEPEIEQDPLAPRINPDLLGHEAAEAALVRMARAGRLPHAILIGGPRGIGKATLAFRLARWLLAGKDEAEAGGLFGAPPEESDRLEVDATEPAVRRIAAQAHADLLTIERGWDPKRKKLRGEIVIDDVREVSAFLRLTAAEGRWRIVVIDSADDMNRNAANALLKVLEEPPRQALLLIVCHEPGRLLPTIRSRCRRVTLAPLAAETVAALLRQRLPDLSESEAASLARMGEGSIGRALSLASGGGLDLYREVLALLADLPRLNGIALHRLGDRVARADGEEAMALLAELLDGFMTAMIAGAARGDFPERVQGEAEVMRNLAARARLDQWVEVWENQGSLFRQADGLNLDRKQIVLDIFLALAALAR